MAKKGTKKVCGRGHIFYQSSDSPVCPKCWPGYYNKNRTDLPKIGVAASRALLANRITRVTQLTKYAEGELLALHGIGPKAMNTLRIALRKKGKTFRKE